MKKGILSEICIALLLSLFAYTSVSKFLAYDLFVFQMRRVPLPVLQSAAPILGWFMPAIEMLIVAGLLVGQTRLKALYASVGLLVLFEIYITAMLLSGMNLPCTCGGIIATMSWKLHLFFNALFIGISLTAIVQIKKQHPNPVPGKGNIQDLFARKSR